MIHTHNHLRLGDNLVQLNFLRRLLAENPKTKITHYYNPQLCKGEEIMPLREGLEERLFIEVKGQPAESLDSWRGQEWYGHPDKLDFAKFHLDWFKSLSHKMGFLSPIRSREDLLFDYPALLQPTPTYDVIVINSQGLSGQFGGHNEMMYGELIKWLQGKGNSVLSTKPTGLCDDPTGKDVSWIGAVSTKAKIIVGNSTGVSWPCLNIHNQEALHILCLDTEEVVLTKRGKTVRSIGEAIKLLV